MTSISIDTKLLPILSAEELNRAICKAQNGCEESRDLVVQANLKLVLKFLHRFKGRERHFEDMFQVGVIGLLKCIDAFDTKRGYKFSTYAFPLIVGEMKRFLRDHSSTMRVSRGIKENALRIALYTEKHLSSHGEEPSVSILEKNLGIPIADILLALDSSRDLISLESNPLKQGEGCLANSIPSNQNPFEDWLISEEIQRGLNSLKYIEKSVIEKRFFEFKMQEEVASELNISQAQVSRLEKRSLLRLKETL